MGTYTLYGLKLQYPADVESYAREFRDYRSRKDELLARFDKMYRDYGSMDTMMNKIDNDIEALLAELVEYYVNQMVDKGFYDLSGDMFISKYWNQVTDSIRSTDAVDNVREKYEEIIAGKEQAAEYRRMRKANRGRWQGGGFGVGGAIKGAAVAGTFNAIGGVGHSMANAVGNLDSSIAASGEKRKLYTSKNTKEDIRSGLDTDFFYIFLAHLKMCREKTGEIFKERTKEALNRVNNMVENIEGRDLPEEERKRLIKEMLELDPYNYRLYHYLLIKRGDKTGELQKLAAHFAAGDYLSSCKRDILADIYNHTNAKTLAEWNAVREQLCASIEANGVKQAAYEDILADVDEKIEKRKQIECTFDGVTYDSIEQMEQAKAEKAKLESMTQLDKLGTEFELRQAKEAIENLELELYPKDAYIEKVETALNAKILERENHEIDEIVNSIDTLNTQSVMDAHRKLQELQVEQANKTEAMEHVQYIVDHLDEIQCTVDGVLYSDFDTANEARAEKKECEDLIGRYIFSSEEQVAAALKELAVLPIKHLDKKIYEEKIHALRLEYREKQMLEKAGQYFESDQYEAAIKDLKTSDLPDTSKEKLKKELDHTLSEKFAEKIEESRKYTKKTQWGNIIIGMAIILVIGYFLSSVFPIVFMIAVVLDVLCLAGTIMENKKRKGYKGSYEFIKKLESYGYEFQ
jgi:hypothetical protein